MLQHLRVHILGLLLLVGLAVCLTLPAAAVTVPEAHWAAQDLAWAVDCGILAGDENGELNPDNALTGAQAATILTRILQLEDDVDGYPGIAEDAWYYDAAAKAVTAGVLPADGSLNLDGPLTRGQAWVLLTRAFGLNRALAEEQVLAAYPDMDASDPEVRRAAAVLASQGIVTGYNSRLEPEGTLTRSQFVTMLHRLLNWLDTELVTDVELTMGPVETEGNLFFSGPVWKLTLQDVDAGMILIRSANLRSLIMDNVKADTLALLQQTGTMIMSCEDLNSLILGSGNGTFSQGELQDVQIVGSGATIRLEGMQIGTLAISGMGNTITVSQETQVGQILFTQDSAENQLKLFGRTETVDLYGRNNTVGGDGYATTVNRMSGSCTADVNCGTLYELDPAQIGLEGLNVTITQATADFQTRGTLTASAVLSGTAGPITVQADWYVSGELAETQTLELTDGAEAGYLEPLSYSAARTLTDNPSVELVIRYDNPYTGQTETVAGQSTLSVIGMTPAQYQAYQAQLAATVSGIYAGNYTESYDIDYTDEVKEAFINAGGYTSQTDYLVWVSRATQKVNIFQRDDYGSWTVIHTFRCGTGASGTPAGITYIWFKESGWYMSSYTVYNVVRFYPGSGYAFHSRLYYPGTYELKEPGIGYPISHGCVRMYLEDVQWMWDTLPLNTTVVIY